MTSRAEELADKLNSLCVAEFAWPHLNDAAEELRRLHAANVYTSDLCTQALDDVRRLSAEVGSLKLAEEGAKEAFGHVVQEKRDLEKALKHCEANLHSANEIIRNQAKAKFLEVKHG